MRVYSLVQECLRFIGQETAEKGEDEHSSFNQILRIKAVHFLAFFILVYVSVEVTIGGMVIHRPSSQKLIWLDCHIYARRTGSLCRLYLVRFFRGCLLYWAANSIQTCTGLMVGRILLPWINRKVSCYDYQVFLISLSLIS